MKDKIFWASIILIILSWVGNSLFYETKQLEEPIFLDHYYEYFMEENEEGGRLPFYYLTNKTDRTTVNHVEINGIEAYPYTQNDFFNWNTNDTPQYEKEFTHYYVKSLYVTFPNHEENVSFSEMKVYFSDGTSVVADIGEVNIVNRDKFDHVLDFRVSGSSNQHIEHKAFLATEPIKITDIEVPFKKDFEIKINNDQERLKELESYGESSTPSWFDEVLGYGWNNLSGELLTDEMLPIQLKKGDWFHYMFKFEQNTHSYSQFNVYVKGTRENGEPFITGDPVNDQPTLTEETIESIIENKQGGGSH